MVFTCWIDFARQYKAKNNKNRLKEASEAWKVYQKEHPEIANMPKAKKVSKCKSRKKKASKKIRGSRKIKKMLLDHCKMCKDCIGEIKRVL